MLLFCPPQESDHRINRFVEILLMFFLKHEPTSCVPFDASFSFHVLNNPSTTSIDAQIIKVELSFIIDNACRHFGPHKNFLQVATFKSGSECASSKSFFICNCKDSASSKWLLCKYSRIRRVDAFASLVFTLKMSHFLEVSFWVLLNRSLKYL